MDSFDALTPVRATRAPRSVLAGHRLLRAVLVVGFAYALGAQYNWLLQDTSLGAAFYPPVGLVLAALVIAPRRWWPALVVTAVVIEIGMDAAHGIDVATTLGFAAVNVVEPVLGAALIGAAASSSSPRRRLAAFLVFAVVLAPLVGAIIGGTTMNVVNDETWWVTVGQWWVGDGLGILIVAAAILAWQGFFESEELRSGLVSVGAILAAAAALAVTVLVSFVDVPLGFLILLPLLFVGMRDGVRPVTLVGVPIALIAVWAAKSGDGHFAHLVDQRHNSLVLVQLWIGVTMVCALLFVTEVRARLGAEAALRRARLRQTEAELTAVHAVADVREVLVREVHDVVGNTVNVMIIQAGAASTMLDLDVSRAASLLASIQDVGRRGLDQLDTALHLGSSSGALDSAASLEQVAELADTMREAGIVIDVRIEGSPLPIRPIVDWTAFRVIQEALTNVVKHSGQQRATVLIHYRVDSVTVTVSNPGSGNGAGAHRIGNGIQGMRDRVAVLGGVLKAQADRAGGFVVEASLPLTTGEALSPASS